MASISRRRMLITGAAGGLALAGLWPQAGMAKAPRGGTELLHWRGSALGASAEMRLLHPEGMKTGHFVKLALDEIERLERIFSLYRPDSALVALNRDGFLASPPLDLVMLLNEAQGLAGRSGGAFDPTIQPLFALYARHFAVSNANPAGPSPHEITRSLALVDYAAMEILPERIAFGRAGMAVTLNGIAQGYLADRVTARLAEAGITDAMVNLGEITALGRAPDGTAWRAGIAGSDQVLDMGTQPGAFAALATSGAAGTVFEPSGRHNHLLDPRTGCSVVAGRLVSVAAATATLADGLSTALAILPRGEGRRLQMQYPDIRVVEGS
jgi:thiamine biosynthesis lipoprotein